MKPCPHCKSIDVRAMKAKAMLGYWVFCIDCLLRGPICATEQAAVEAWDKLPRAGDLPAETGLTLTAAGVDYTVVFLHSGRATYCAITWLSSAGRRVGVAGAAFCSPADTYDAAVGERLAMRKACAIGFSRWDRRFDLRDLWSVYRRHVRQAANAADLAELTARGVQPLGA